MGLSCWNWAILAVAPLVGHAKSLSSLGRGCWTARKILEAKVLTCKILRDKGLALDSTARNGRGGENVKATATS